MIKNIRYDLILLSIVVIAIGAFLRVSSLHFHYDHPDEIITVKVVEAMIANKSLDTNFESADLPVYFKYPQYNFSGYMLFSATIAKAAKTLSLQHKFTALELFRGASAMLGVLVIMLTILLGRRLFNFETGILAGSFVAVNPLLYQDSLYARPESFVTAITLVFLYVLSSPKIPALWRYLAASIILGVLVATKVSMLLLAPFLLLKSVSPHVDAGLVAGVWVYVKSCIKISPLAAISIPVGFFAGFFCFAPFAVINFSKFISGVRHLNEQYSNGHWPHGVTDGGLFDRFSYAVNYFSPTVGLVFFLVLLGGGWLMVKERRFGLRIIFIAFSVFAIRFAVYSTFFERNFSHLLPLACIFAAYAVFRAVQVLSLRPALRLLIIIFVSLLVMLPSIKTLSILRFEMLPGHFLAEINHIRSRLGYEYGVDSIKTGWIRDYSEVKARYGKLCEPVLLEFPYPNDKYTLDTLNKIKSLDGYVELARSASPFQAVSPSTLHTYFTPVTLFLFKDLDEKRCADTKMKLVSRTVAGSAITAVDTHLIYADATWTKQGAYGNILDSFGSKDYYGSWSGADAGKGTLQINVNIGEKNLLILPYLTGPVSNKQFVKIKNAVTQDIIFDSGPLKSTETWKFMRITLPVGVKVITIEAKDDGSDSGEWQAIGQPRI